MPLLDSNDALFIRCHIYWIATIICVTSHYGDKTLFFENQYINEDKNLKPEWTDEYDKEFYPFCVILPFMSVYISIISLCFGCSLAPN